MVRCATLALVVVPLTAADQPRKARPEPMAADRFAEIHSPLFQPAKAKEAGAITERVLPSGGAQARAAAPRRNFIDRHIFGKLERDGVPHAALAGDYEFLRRVSLDLTGRIPLPEEVRAFAADPDPAKRDKLIDRLFD